MLSLANSDIGDVGVRELANANLINLSSLHLEWNKIGNGGAKALANGNFTKLTSLTLVGNKIGYMCARALAELSNLTSFTYGRDRNWC